MLNDVLEFIYISKSYKNSPIPHEERMILNFLKKWELNIIVNQYIIKNEMREIKFSGN